MTKPDEPLIQITKDGIRVVSEDVSAKLAKKKLSASTISGLQGCPAGWLANSFVIPEIITDDQPDNPARRGSLFHQVMENFFALPAEERTHGAMRKEVKAVLDSDDYKDLAKNAEVVEWLRGAVNGYYNMHADTDPSEVVIAELETHSSRGKGTALEEVLHSVREQYESGESEQVETSVIDSVLSKWAYKDLREDNDARKWITEAAESYIRKFGANGDGDPENGELDALVAAGNREIKPGLEIFVIGQIGEAKRQTLGFIDRLQEIERDEGSDHSSVVSVEDWKTGAKVKRYNPKTRAKNPEGLNEQRQQIIYSMLLEQEHGVRVGSARLIYPVAKEVLEVDLSDENLRERVVKDVEEADTQLTNHIQRNLFEYNPSILCSWCPLAKVCSAAKQFPRVEKAMKAWNDQPEPEDLAKAIDFGGR